MWLIERSILEFTWKQNHNVYWKGQASNKESEYRVVASKCVEHQVQFSLDSGSHYSHSKWPKYFDSRLHPFRILHCLRATIIMEMSEKHLHRFGPTLDWSLNVWQTREWINIFINVGAHGLLKAQSKQCIEPIHHQYLPSTVIESPGKNYHHPMSSISVMQIPCQVRQPMECCSMTKGDSPWLRWNSYSECWLVEID